MNDKHTVCTVFSTYAAILSLKYIVHVSHMYALFQTISTRSWLNPGIQNPRTQRADCRQGSYVTSQVNAHEASPAASI